MARMWKARKAYRGRLQFFGEHVSCMKKTKTKMNIQSIFFLFECQEADVVKIQAFWRAKKAKKDYTQLG